MPTGIAAAPCHEHPRLRQSEALRRRRRRGRPRGRRRTPRRRPARAPPRRRVPRPRGYRSPRAAAASGKARGSIDHAGTLDDAGEAHRPHGLVDPRMPPHLQIDAELQTATRELGLRRRECGAGVARFPLDHDRAERRVGQVREREHEAVDLEHLGARHVRPARALGGHESRARVVRPDPRTAVCQERPRRRPVGSTGAGRRPSSWTSTAPRARTTSPSTCCASSPTGTGRASTRRGNEVDVGSQEVVAAQSAMLDADRDTHARRSPQPTARWTPRSRRS